MEMVSQGKAAEIAGLSPAQFLEELFRRKVPARFVDNASPFIFLAAIAALVQRRWPGRLPLPDRYHELADRCYSRK
jgi:hypothetical protein